jgi:hypothetical protein
VQEGQEFLPSCSASSSAAPVPAPAAPAIYCQWPSTPNSPHFQPESQAVMAVEPLLYFKDVKNIKNTSFSKKSSNPSLHFF